uniref:UDP-sugar pyrophospharylase n=1 Tax=Anthurium amnicola TaxID=1678845 RepID=A0A1D1XVY6_9ARAE
MAHAASGVRLPLLSHNAFSSSSFPSSSLLPSISARRRVLQSRKSPSSSSLVHSPFPFSCSSSAHGVVRRVSTAPVEQAPAPDFDFSEEIARLEALRSRIQASKSLREKLLVLDADPRVNGFFGCRRRGVSRVLSRLDLSELFLLKCLVAAGQGHVLGSEMDVDGGDARAEGSALKNAFYVLAEMIESWSSDGNGVGGGNNGVGIAALQGLLGTLREIEQFYDCVGGIIGYQIMILGLLSPSTVEGQSRSWSCHLDKSMTYQLMEFHVPSGLNLSVETEYASQAALWGIEGLPELGELYPLGGSGDRLGLVDPVTGECLPSAMLPYCGRTLLEGLIRDLQAREFLYFKLYGKQCITPVAIMTSSAKNNHRRVTALCESLQWFGRSRQNFQLFEQPLVPVVAAEDGRWLISKPFLPVCKPGGHGAIWKLAHDKGIFKWFYSHGRKGATVRQVSNVVAATDLTLLSLAGIGLHHGKKLGFASCQRNPGATEGINVLVEKKSFDGQWTYGLTCIEYTEFEKFGIMDEPSSPNSFSHVLGLSLQAEFPANTNILYIDLPSAEKVGSSRSAACLPGMVLNLKKPVQYVDCFGIKHSVSGGRLECTMQNIADNFMNAYSSRCYKCVEEGLDTFIVYNERQRVTSSAKKKRRWNAKSLNQTPDGSLLDITRNTSDLLSFCDIKIPKIGDNSKYLDSGPPFLIFLHPALGPLWEVTRQKFHGGYISEGSELQIEVAEFLWRDVQLDGSLIVVAENVMGSTVASEHGEPILQYGHRCGRCKLQNVKVLNKGIDWSADNVYWEHDVQRFEMLKIILHGNAEFEAANIILQGKHFFEVPDGYKMCLSACDSGFQVNLHPIREEMMGSGSWFWKYSLDGTHIHLEMVEL